MINKLIDYLLNDKDAPVIFNKYDIEKVGLEKGEYEVFLNDGLYKKYIENIYNDVNIVTKKYRKRFLSEYMIMQKIEPKSYLSTWKILCDCAWIPEFIFSTTSITENKSLKVEVKNFGTFKYKKLYDTYYESGIYEEEFDGVRYKRAKPLRALCDLVYHKGLTCVDLEYLYEDMRLDRFSMEEDLCSEDFDELQGKFGISVIERLVENTRKELKL